MGDDRAKPISDQWALLEEHFHHHARLIKRFREASPSAVTRMWKSGTNESGEPLSQFEIDAPRGTLLRVVWKLAGVTSQAYFTSLPSQCETRGAQVHDTTKL
jgi:hypothetical protein